MDRPVRHAVRRAWRFFAGGVATAALLAAVHYLPGSPLPAGGVSTALQHWDGHRQPFDLLSRPALGLYFSVVFAAYWLWRFRSRLSTRTISSLRLLLATALIGGVFSSSYWLIPSDVPSLVAWLMPSRILNVNGMTCMAVIIGLSAAHRSNVSIQWTLGALIVVLLGLTVWMGPDDDGQFRARAAWVAMGVAGVIVSWLAGRSRSGVPERDAERARRIRVAAVGTLSAAVLVVVAVGVARLESRLREYLPGQDTDLALAAAASGEGLLLTGHRIHIVQAQTRRPVLLDGFAIDGLNYAPEAAPETDRILRAVYGTTLADVQKAGEGALVDEEGNRALWETRSECEWRAIAREFGVTGVLTSHDWRLQLPARAKGAELVLYDIPTGDAGDPSCAGHASH
jgi:hypothetical protein